uniref:LRAT domain-containing protein n=1 Tax=Strigamia maritima TaxID=126957 RepID=T1ILD5_STRMM
MGGSPSKFEEFCNTLHIGDLIEFPPTDNNFAHWAVYVGSSGGKAGAAAAEAMRNLHYDQLIHLRKKMQCEAIIRLEPIEDVPNFENAKVNNYHDPFTNRLHDYVIEANANREKDKIIQFHSIANNCEHFATNCRYGKKMSNQSVNLVLAHPELINKICEDDVVLREYVQTIIPNQIKVDKGGSSAKISPITTQEKRSFVIHTDNKNTAFLDKLEGSAEPLSHCPIKPVRPNVRFFNPPRKIEEKSFDKLKTRPLSNQTSSMSYRPVGSVRPNAQLVNPPLKIQEKSFDKLNVNNPLSHLTSPVSHLSGPLSLQTGQLRRGFIETNSPNAQLVNPPLKIQEKSFDKLNVNNPLSHLTSPVSHLSGPLNLQTGQLRRGPIETNNPNAKLVGPFLKVDDKSFDKLTTATRKSFKAKPVSHLFNQQVPLRPQFIQVVWILLIPLVTRHDQKSQTDISEEIELKDQKLRKRNVVIYGFPEASDNWMDDVLTVKKLLEDLDLKDQLAIPKNLIEIKRLGRFDPSKKRLLRLKFDVIKNRDFFFQSATTLLQQFPQYSKLSIKDDLTATQQLALFNRGRRNK